MLVERRGLSLGNRPPEGDEIAPQDIDVDVDLTGPGVAIIGGLVETRRRGSGSTRSIRSATGSGFDATSFLSDDATTAPPLGQSGSGVLL